MNYYNPYIGMYPYTASPVSTGLIGRALGGSGIKWGSILSGTQKVLGIANQAIPVIKQVKPVVNNAKTMFRVMNEFKKVDGSTSSTDTTTNLENEIHEENIQDFSDQNGPTFFI